LSLALALKDRAWGRGEKKKKEKKKCTPLSPVSKYALLDANKKEKEGNRKRKRNKLPNHISCAI